jgi:adenine deaminase
MEQSWALHFAAARRYWREGVRRRDAMAKFDLIVRGGRVIDPASGIDGAHDVAVKDGTIAQVAPRIAGTAARTVNAGISSWSPA